MNRYSILTLRNWDFLLLKRYKPNFSISSDICNLCLLGPCKLTSALRGACGIDLYSQQARKIALYSCIGASAHLSHANELFNEVSKYMGSKKVYLGNEIEAPITRVLVGKPKNINEFGIGIDYIHKEMAALVSSISTGQECNVFDYLSKAFHAGMLDLLSMEIADILQIIGYRFKKYNVNVEFIPVSEDSIDRDKAIILCIGHNIVKNQGIVSYKEKNGIEDVEVCGLCCIGHELSRMNEKCKIIGSYKDQMKFVRKGIADVIVLDEQCIRSDVLFEAEKFGTVVIATSEKKCLGLKDLTKLKTNEIISELVHGKENSILLADKEKVGEVAVEVARILHKNRKKMIEEKKQKSKDCNGCGSCDEVCPMKLKISSAMKKLRLFHELELHQLYKNSNEIKLNKGLAKLSKICIGCMRCEQVCKNKVKIFDIISSFCQKEKKSMRWGRGPIMDFEVKAVAPSIVLGEIPGIVILAGCSYNKAVGEGIEEIGKEFLKRRYILLSAGCSAIESANLFENYPGRFNGANIINLGSCISGAHAIGSAIKISSILSMKPYEFIGIADYIINRIGAVLVLFGSFHQKALATAMGAIRWGIPVLWGSIGEKLNFSLKSDKNLKIYDKRAKEIVNCEPAPQELFSVASSLDDAKVKIAKLCIRPNDTIKGRKIKLSNYIELNKKVYGTIPEDLWLFTRALNELPKNKEFYHLLEKKNWSKKRIPDPTLIQFI
ncbi:MAG: 4Fe-4S dicluster domain-containing protein [Candidatus Thermoplasmatota archaeon]